MFNHLKTFPNPCEILFNVDDVVLKFGSPKRKIHKIQRNNAPFKTFENFAFGTKKLKKTKTKIATPNMVKF
jgi:hypothetical protein